MLRSTRAVKLSYQWYAGTKKLSGATKTGYTTTTRASAVTSKIAK